MAATDYDVLIVGGGMVGASMALALAPLGLKVGIVEAFAFNPSQTQPAYDDRSIALSHGSRLIFQGVGLWSKIARQVADIQHIHVSDRGYFGATRLHADKENVPALGHVIQSRVLGTALHQTLQATDVDWFMPANVVELVQDEQHVQVQLTTADAQQTLSTRLLIAADGTHSKLRELAGIGIEQRDYQQTAIIANVSTDRASNAWAYERFTENGPIALLPMTAAADNPHRWSLVWTHQQAAADTYQHQSDSDFLHALQQAFGHRAGRFIKVGKRSSYPLSLVRSFKDVQNRIVIIGNASHTLHPVAGQGLNLALRDVAVLADLLSHITDYQQDCGHPHLLADYAEQREADYRTTIPYTDSLVRLFSNDYPLLGHLRAGGLMSVDRVKPLRRLLAEQSMGLKHRQARLSRGLSLRTGAAA